jgi:hypothetical protein
LKASFDLNLSIALIHYPVTNKNGEVIASAVTNLDLHDMARSARTYGVAAFYVVTPLEDQQALAAKLVDHWVSGGGARYNPKRCEALQLVHIRDNLAQVVAEIERAQGRRPKTIVTCARPQTGSVAYGTLRKTLGDGAPGLLLFGTAWGLAPDCMSTADIILDPVRGIGSYNHLSVRSAAAIILDRLCGEFS